MSNQNGSLIKHTAVPAAVLHENMNDSRSCCQVLVLDCCFSGAFAKRFSIKDDESIDIRAQLGGKGRAIFTSSNSIEYSFVEHDYKLSVYTHFFVEGLRTGAADLDNDGLVSTDELHTYVSNQVRERFPKMTPQFFTTEQGYKIYLPCNVFADNEGLKQIIDFLNLVNSNSRTKHAVRIGAIGDSFEINLSDSSGVLKVFTTVELSLSLWDEFHRTYIFDKREAIRAASALVQTGYATISTNCSYYEKGSSFDGFGSGDGRRDIVGTGTLSVVLRVTPDRKLEIGSLNYSPITQVVVFDNSKDEV
ncbi:caspase family protein [Nostoc sp.]|uniref:caspase family protein n=1 Tax=Nostoc sp. TaxID=1180 RepID=UPI002FF8C461